MDDLKYGARNARGDYAPKEPAQIVPLFVFPPQPAAFLKWLPHYIWPWNVFYYATALLLWNYALPDVGAIKTWGLWIVWLFAINVVATFLFYGAFELRLYILRGQGSRFKYNARWPAEQRSGKFMFERQDVDNIIRTFSSGVTIWTAVEVIILMLYANGYGPWLQFSQHPIYLLILALLVPLLHEAHFYVLHRTLHIPPLYKIAHAVHHNAVNPSPWSSLSMHPIEHIGYFGVAFWCLIIPSHPVLAIYLLHRAGFGAIPGHIGFDKIELGGGQTMNSEAYLHYLHHKYYEVNYGDAMIPFDKWFGTFHDGSAEGEARMKECRRSALGGS